MKQRYYHLLTKHQLLIGLLSLTALLVFGWLGSQALWTQEGRWGTICWNMLIRHDYLHPYCYGYPYYDKPLLTYWLPLMITAISGKFNAWTLRLPSAIAGVISVFSIYHIGAKTENRRLGLIAAAILCTTFYFIFWARVASADMTNIAGILLALAWYFSHRGQRSVWSYSVFFIILALTALCKGLLAPVVAALALLPELCYQQRWRQHINISFLVALGTGILVYLTPFFLSLWINDGSYHQSGLWLVFRENLLRYFSAFDHIEPFYVYFYYVPLYLLPWTPLFMPALFIQIKNRKTLSQGARWSISTFLLIFIFLSCSESRRNYYALITVPFAALVTAHWINDASHTIQRLARYVFYFGAMINLSFFVIANTPFFSQTNTLEQLATQGKQAAINITPWQDWQLVMVDATIKMPFYFRSNKPARYINPDKLKQQLPALQKRYPHHLIITRSQSYRHIAKHLPHYLVFKESRTRLDAWLGRTDDNYSLVLMPPHHKK